MSKRIKGFSLATESGIALLTSLLMLSGAQCLCGYGTRVTSKKWARCKKCGQRVERRTIEEAGALLRRESI